MARPTKFEIRQTTSEGSLNVAVTGELDMNTAQTLSEHLDQNLNDETTVLELDLSELTFMDSSGLRFLIELHERAEAASWLLKLTPPRHDAAALVLRATGADTALPFES